MICNDLALNPRVYLAIPDTDVTVLTDVFMTGRGFVHLEALTPLEAFDVAPFICTHDIERIADPFAREKARASRSIRALQPLRGRRAA